MINNYRKIFPKEPEKKTIGFGLQIILSYIVVMLIGFILGIILF